MKETSFRITRGLLWDYLLFYIWLRLSLSFIHLTCHFLLQRTLRNISLFLYLVKVKRSSSGGWSIPSLIPKARQIELAWISGFLIIYTGRLPMRVISSPFTWQGDASSIFYVLLVHTMYSHPISRKRDSDVPAISFFDSCWPRDIHEKIYRAIVPLPETRGNIHVDVIHLSNDPTWRR